jgi:hypothetical protein
MTRKRTIRFAAAAVTLGLVVAACGGDDDDAVEEPAEEPARAEPAEEPAEEPADEPAAEEPAEEPAAEIDLASVCPSPLVIQTDWFPEAEHGALYQMVGEGYTVDTENLTVTGPLWAPGPTPTGIDIQVRTGGPAIGFNAPRVNMYTDDSIHIGYSSFDAQAAAWEDTPLISVMAPLEKNPQIIMWDADAWPDVETIADLGEAGVTSTCSPVAASPTTSWRPASGAPTRSTRRTTDRRPASSPRATSPSRASPRPSRTTTSSSSRSTARRRSTSSCTTPAIETYSQTLAVKPDVLEELRPCLEQFIPIVQQSVIDFANDPARANAIIIDAVAQFDSFWVYDEGVANFAVETMTELGLHGNGPDSTVGNMDEARVQKVIDDARLAGVPVPEDLVAADMFTNEFIDESIGF